VRGSIGPIGKQNSVKIKPGKGIHEWQNYDCERKTDRNGAIRECLVVG